MIIAKRDICRDVPVTSCRLETREIQVRIPAQAETCLFTSDLKPNLILPNGDRGHFSQRLSSRDVNVATHLHLVTRLKNVCSCAPSPHTAHLRQQCHNSKFEIFFPGETLEGFEV